MPLDIPFLLHREQQMSSPSVDPWTSSLSGNGGKGPPPNPEVIHNHYYATGPKPVPWYRRKRSIWTAIAVLVFVAVAAAVTLGVVLQLQARKSRLRDVASGLTDQVTPTSPRSTSETTAHSGNSDSGTTVSAFAFPSSSATSKAAAETQMAVFTVFKESQLASVYLDNEKQNLRRRLLVWQDEKGDLIVTDWSVGNKTHYRLRDQLRSSIPDAKLGTPLAIAGSSSGAVHLFFLDTQNALSHVFQPAAGFWEKSSLSKSNDLTVASDSSPLSAAWHGIRNGMELLVVAYASSQDLHLVMTDKPTTDSTWLAVDVTSLPASVPGQGEKPRFAIAGDWRTWGESRPMLMAVLVEDGLFAYECLIDTWPPESSTPCLRTSGALKDEKGRDAVSAPPPKQLGWIRLGGSTDGYDFSLVSLGEDGFIGEDRVGDGLVRKAGRGLDTKMAVRAISATAEAVLFAAAGGNVYMYRLKTEDGTWQAEGQLMPARGGM